MQAEQSKTSKRQKSPKKVIVFIDGNNLFHRMWEFYKTHRIDIQELSKTLCCSNRDLKQIRYYYSPFIKQVNEKTALLQQVYVEDMRKAITNLHISQGKYIKTKTLLKKEVFEKIKGIITSEDLVGYVEKGIDVQITVDMINLGIRKEYDTAILVSTDSDFVPILTCLKAYNIKMQVAAFQDALHSCFDLKNHCKSFINLHHYIPAVLKKQKSRT